MQAWQPISAHGSITPHENKSQHIPALYDHRRVGCRVCLYAGNTDCYTGHANAADKPNYTTAGHKCRGGSIRDTDK